MLFAQQQQPNGSPSGSNATAITAESEAIAEARAAAAAAAAAAASRENGDVDHDMETDITDNHKPLRLFRRSDMMKQQLMKEQQEISTRILKSHHNPRLRHYPGYQSLYYSHNNHHNHNSHYTLRHHLYYNPHTYRKFPPYQYWAASAQRNYHLATIGVMPSPSTSTTSDFSAYAEHARNDFLVYAESAILAFAGGRPPPGVGDRILRTSIRNGGVSKSASSSSSPSAYPSRLPVHFRHMTSRTNRRSAVCVNQLQGEQQQQYNRETAVSGVLPLFSGLSIEGSSAQSDLPSTGRNNTDSSSSSMTRKKLTDWKRVTAFNLDLGDDPKRGNSNDLGSTPKSSSASGGSSSSAKGSSGGGRHWINQRGGLANLLQARQSQDGSVSGSGTVDRLVEEMSKWSV
ncbi:hypothetical protein BGX21_003986 [Mortierella sp. AD011]|nr:hypothetical protein BGX20_005643 [Mortierella sp. AD010]KAF9374950.1 hypothetical protein BGX21_003986 [Mortierella sp. AD011]